MDDFVRRLVATTTPARQDPTWAVGLVVEIAAGLQRSAYEREGACGVSARQAFLFDRDALPHDDVPYGPQPPPPPVTVWWMSVVSC